MVPGYLGPSAPRDVGLLAQGRGEYRVAKLSEKWAFRKANRFDPTDPQQLEQALNQFEHEGWRVVSVAPVVEAVEGISSVVVLVVLWR